MNTLFNNTYPINKTLSSGESYLSMEMPSVYSTAQADWATGHSLWESNPSAEMQSVYPTAQAE